MVMRRMNPTRVATDKLEIQEVAAGGFPMNHSIYSADRTTHLKIVVVALVAGISVAGLGIAARSTSDDYTQTARVLKAGKPVAITSAGTSTVR
jgi:hypothetical protein